MEHTNKPAAKRGWAVHYSKFNSTNWMSPTLCNSRNAAISIQAGLPTTDVTCVRCLAVLAARAAKASK